MMTNNTALSGLLDSDFTVSQGSASLHPGLRVLRPYGTKIYGNVGVAMVKDLIATVEREKAAMGLFVTLAPPTRPMKEEAVSTGFYNQDKWAAEYPKLQILTIEGLMTGTERPRFPDLTMGRSTFKRAAVEDMGAEQGKLL
jgi:hypothetical protein